MIDVESDFQRMQDYVGGRLSDEEHRAFEERLVRDPELVREFEHSLRLREGLEQLREQRRSSRWCCGCARNSTRQTLQVFSPLRQPSRGRQWHISPS
jgi:anti-sigma factor RsiW